MRHLTSGISADFYNLVAERMMGLLHVIFGDRATRLRPGLIDHDDSQQGTGPDTQWCSDTRCGTFGMQIMAISGGLIPLGRILRAINDCQHLLDTAQCHMVLAEGNAELALA